jgi:perosamine synthetase
MSNVQAALGLGQIERADALIAAKRRIFTWYREALEGIPHLELNREMPDARSICWMTSIIVEDGAPVSRDRLREELLKRNIDTRPAFPAISQYPIWPVAQSPQPVAKFIGERAINLPSGVRLKREEIDYVAESIKRILTRT